MVAADGREREGYTATAIALHWVVAALVALQLMTKLVDPASVGTSEDGLNVWHLALGPTILLLMLIRLVWRWRHGAPPPPADLSAPLRRLAAATHWGLYALLIALPLAGWMSASGFGVRPTLAGLVTLPALAGQDKARAETWGSIHGALAWLLVALVALHVCGVLYHVLAKDDGVPARMISPVKAPGGPSSR